MLTSQSVSAWRRWIVILLAASMASGGCQSLATRGQGPLEDIAPLTPPEEPMTEPQAEPATSPAQPETAPQAQPETTAPKAVTAKAAPKSAVKKPLAKAVRPAMYGAPSELRKSTLPTYIVEPPDILLIDAIKLVPKPPYHIEALDVLQIVVVGTLLGQDISGQFVVDASGLVDLGPAYGKVPVVGLSIDEARETIDKHLRRILREPEVSVSLSQSVGQQQVSGDHLVTPDGTVNLGTYGSVFVAGLTLAEVKEAVEKQLGKYLLEPRVSVDIYSYNSKVYYIVSEGAGLGDGITRVTITGNETVLDALAQVNGLSRLSSKKIWIARPIPGGAGCEQILPVNYRDITAGAVTATNYQILPGDRIFLAEDKFIAVDNFVTRLTAPFERVVGFSLLGAQAVQTFNRFPTGITGSGVF